jgi:8-oxo-dGTP pyrophosphatase MutT (NUDIX family)
MEQLVNAFWRTVYRLGYPCAQVVWQLTRTPGRGATVAVWHAGRLLCVRESYRRGLGLPGGGSHGGEIPAATARRELREEVGLDLGPDRFHDRGLLAYPIGARLIEDRLFEVHLEVPLEPVIDAREIVWAGYLEPGQIRAAGMQRGMRLYLERTGHGHDAA